MKKIDLSKAVFTAMLLASSLANAGTNYPAADFKPKVVFQDAEEIAKHKTSPAAAVVVDDPKYPAANFKPAVVYRDDNYKASASSSSQSAKSSTSASVSNSSESSDEAGASKEGSNQTTLFGLIALAVVGFVLINKKSSSSSKDSASSASTYKPSRGADASGLTGVAKYLKSQEKETAVSSVAKYIEKREQNPKSSVAKYVARQVILARQRAEESATGVEKYLRKRG